MEWTDREDRSNRHRGGCPCRGPPGRPRCRSSTPPMPRGGRRAACRGPRPRRHSRRASGWLVRRTREARRGGRWPLAFGRRKERESLLGGQKQQLMRSDAQVHAQCAGRWMTTACRTVVGLGTAHYCGREEGKVCGSPPTGPLLQLQWRAACWPGIPDRGAEGTTARAQPFPAHSSLYHVPELSHSRVLYFIL